MHAWSLLIFSLLTQMSVGTWVLLVLFNWRPDSNGLGFLPDKLLPALTGFMAVAMLMSLLHLGQPLKAPLAILNLKTSWLSREILGVVLFFGGTALTTLLNWKRWGSDRLLRTLMRITAVIGLLLLFVMTKIYMMPTVPTWNHPMTPVSFYVTAFTLGGAVLLTGMLLMRSASINPRGISLMTALLLCVEILLMPVLILVLKGGDLNAVMADRVLSDHLMLILARLVAASTAVGVLGFGGFLSRDGGAVDVLRQRSWLVLGLVALTEVLGKVFFYASYMRVGV